MNREELKDLFAKEGMITWEGRPLKIKQISVKDMNSITKMESGSVGMYLVKEVLKENIPDIKDEEIDKIDSKKIVSLMTEINKFHGFTKTVEERKNE